MPSWREALGQGATSRRNALLAVSSLFFLTAVVTRDARNLFFVALALLLAYLSMARLEWRWSYPSRIKRGQVLGVAIHIKNRALRFSLVKGDAVRNVRFTLDARPPLTVVGRATREIEALGAGEEAAMRFEMRCPKETPPDLYEFSIVSHSSAGSREKSFEVYVYEEE